VRKEVTGPAEGTGRRGQPGAGHEEARLRALRTSLLGLGLLSLLAVVPAGRMPRRLLTDPRPEDEAEETPSTATPAPAAPAMEQPPSRSPA
jgi:hypothetical protein